MECLQARRSKLSATDVWMALAAIASALLLLFAAAQSQAQTLTVLHNFDLLADGGVPYAGVTLDQQGRIYGTTSDGGTRNGIVYRLVHSGGAWGLTPIYTFRGHPDGSQPFSRVVFGPDGALYGTTYGGGLQNGGTVFKLTPPASVCHAVLCPWTETILYNFTNGADGSGPYYGDLTFDQAGNIYGTTIYGGASGMGVVFKLTRSQNTWTESVLWSFTGGDDGGSPESGVIFDSAGNLYGTTASGGYGSGVIYELSPSASGWTSTTLHIIAEQDGGYSAGGLTMDANENLFGMTGDIYPGALYELTQQGGNWVFTLLQNFTGFYPGPLTAPTFDSQGNLYGPIPTGGSGQNGDIFKLIPSGGGWMYTDYFQFTNTNAYAPVGQLAFDVSGNMYGTTVSGGTRTWGTVWEITP